MSIFIGSYFSNIIYTLLSGGILVILSLMFVRLKVPYIHPCFMFSATWGGALILLSLTPLVGFYFLQSSVLLLYLACAILFSAFSYIIYRVSMNFKEPRVRILDEMNFSKILKFYWLISMLVIPSIVSDIMSYGSSLAEIAYNLRSSQLNGKQVGSFITANYFVVAIFISCLLVYGVTKQKVKVLAVVISLLPFIFLTLILTGRSLLVSLILAWVYTYFFAGGRLSFKSAMIFTLTMFGVLFFGATLVSKVDVEGLGFLSIFLVIFVHIVDYLLQGPILFGLYFDNMIHIRESWDTLDNACHAVSKFGLCEPITNVHADNAYMGDGKLGNVYSFYFATYPHYGIFGTLFFISFYAVVSAVFYYFARRGGLFSFVSSSFLFSAIVLSIYKDGFGDSFWMFIKFYLIALFFSAFFKVKSKDL